MRLVNNFQQEAIKAIKYNPDAGKHSISAVNPGRGRETVLQQCGMLQMKEQSDDLLACEQLTSNMRTNAALSN